MNDLTQLDQLLETAEVIADLGAQGLGKDAGDLLADLPARWTEASIEDHLRAAIPGSRTEAHYALRGDARPVCGLPGDLLVGAAIGDLDIPLQG